MANDVLGGLGGYDDAVILARTRALRPQLQRYSKAIQKAQAAGDSEAVADIKAEFSGLRQEYRDALERQNQWVDTQKGLTRPAVEGNGLQRAMAGVEGGLRLTGGKLGNALGMISDEDLQEQQKMLGPLSEDPAGGAGMFGGALGTYALGGEGEAAMLAQIAKKIPSIAKLIGSGIASPTGRAMVQQARQGAEMGAVEAPSGQRGSGALTGALGGAGAAGLMGGAAALTGGVSRGLTPSPAGAAIASELPTGTLTAGQLNPDSALGRWEQNPVSRLLTTAPRERANERVNLVAANRSSLPLADVQGLNDREMARLAARIEGGERGSLIMPPSNVNNPIKNQLARGAQETFSPYYDALNSYGAGPHIIPASGASNIPLSKRFSSITARSTAAGSQPSTADTFLREQLAATIKAAKQAGGMNMGHLRDLRGNIRAQADKIKGDTPDAAAFKSTLKKAEGAVNEAIESQLPPGARRLWKATDSVYGTNAVLSNATAASKAAGDPLSGYSLENAAIQDTQKKAGRRAVARGEDSTRVRDASGNSVEGTGLRDLGRNWRLINKQHPHTGELNVMDKTLEFLTHLPGGIAGLPGAMLSRSQWGREALQGARPFQQALQGAQASARSYSGKIPITAGGLKAIASGAKRAPLQYLLQHGMRAPIIGSTIGGLSALEPEIALGDEPPQ